MAREIVKYSIEFETDDPEHAQRILLELAETAAKDDLPASGDVYSKDLSIIIGDWSFVSANSSRSR